jgi:hypothetical protein
MIKRLFTILVVMLIALLFSAPVMGGISGTGESGVQIQNLDTDNSAQVTVQLWNQNGSDPIEISATGGDTVEAGAARNYYLPIIDGVDAGAYAMIASADKAIAAIARTDWSASGGAALYSSVDPGSDVTLPLVVSDYAGQTSQFSIQNTNTTDSITDVDITLLGRGLTSPVAELTDQEIPAGTSVSYDVTPATFGVASFPDTGDPGVPGFVGSIRITSSTDLVVQSFIDIPGTPGVTGFSGVASDSAASTLYCPLIRANYYGDTGISVVNPGGSPVDVDITFYADAGSPNSGTYTQELSVEGDSSEVAFQGCGGNSRATPTNLPGGDQACSVGNPTPTHTGFYGVAKLEATGGNILAVVNDTTFGNGWSVEAQSTYNCATAANAGQEFALPLVRRFHLQDTQLTTGIQIQNTTGGPVTVSLDLVNWDGTSQSSSNPDDIVIPPNGSGNFWNGNLTGLPTVPPEFGGYGWFGSAVLSADGDVVVVVSDEGFGSTAVDSANYNALNIPLP